MRKLILTLSACLVAGLFTGCSSGPQTPAGITYKTEGVIITSVDSGMQAWADYVNSGKATSKQVEDVRSAYGKYYEAQQLAKAAIETLVAVKSPDAAEKAMAAQSAVSTAKNALLDLVTTYLKGKI